MSIIFKMKNLENKEIVELTEHTIDSVEEKEDRIGGENILLSKTVDGVVVEGKLNFTDDSEEVLNVGSISEWVKVTPHEKGSEVSLDIEMSTNSGEVYNSFKYEKAFLQHYEEEFDLSNGTGRFRFFVRNKAELDRTLGARIVPMPEGYVDNGVESDSFGVIPVVVHDNVTEGIMKSHNIIKLYKEFNGSGYSYDEADLVFNYAKKVDIEVVGKRNHLGYNFEGNTIVKGNALKAIVEDIGTSPNLVSVTDRDYYVLRVFGDISNSEYKYKYKSGKECDIFKFDNYFMNLKEYFFTENPRYKANNKINPIGIMVHSTGANNPTLKRYVGPDDGALGYNRNNNHWNLSSQSLCVHAFIGKLEDGSVATYQALPWDISTWHCGGSANDTHISFEICEDDLSSLEYFNAAYNEAIALCAYLCRLYKFNPLKDGVLICHSEGYTRGIAGNHGDVMHWFPKHGKDMDKFRQDVNKYIL